MKNLPSALLHENVARKAIQAPFPLLLGLFHPQWTMDGKETGCGGSNGLRQFAMVLMELIEVNRQVNPQVNRKSIPSQSSGFDLISDQLLSTQLRE